MSVDWQSPSELPDLRHAGTIALDCETKDKGLHAKRGPGWPWRGGYITGISLAWRADGAIRAIYIPLCHPDSQNFDREQVISWLRDLIASGVKIITKNGLYGRQPNNSKKSMRSPPWWTKIACATASTRCACGADSPARTRHCYLKAAPRLG
jgi:hypothetical protein